MTLPQQLGRGLRLKRPLGKRSGPKGAMPDPFWEFHSKISRRDIKTKGCWLVWNWKRWECLHEQSPPNWSSGYLRLSMRGAPFSSMSWKDASAKSENLISEGRLRLTVVQCAWGIEFDVRLVFETNGEPELRRVFQLEAIVITLILQFWSLVGGVDEGNRRLDQSAWGGGIGALGQGPLNREGLYEAR